MRCLTSVVLSVVWCFLSLTLFFFVLVGNRITDLFVLGWVLQQLEKAEQEKYELQRKLKTALAGGASASQKVCRRVFFLFHLEYPILFSFISRFP